MGIVPLNGFLGTVTLTLSGLPSGVTSLMARRCDSDLSHRQAEQDERRRTTRLQLNGTPGDGSDGKRKNTTHTGTTKRHGTGPVRSQCSCTGTPTNSVSSVSAR
jgi:hypothetical protein